MNSYRFVAVILVNKSGMDGYRCYDYITPGADWMIIQVCLLKCEPEISSGVTGLHKIIIIKIVKLIFAILIYINLFI